MIKKLKNLSDLDTELIGLGLLLALLIIGLPAVWVGRSYFEARAYNRLTGSEVTTWDAMFVTLRVDLPAKVAEDAKSSGVSE